MYEIKSPMFINERFVADLCYNCPYCELTFEREKEKEYTTYVLSCEHYDLCNFVIENMDDEE